MPPHPWLPPAEKTQLFPDSCGVTSPASRPAGEGSGGAQSRNVRMHSHPCLMDALPSRDSAWKAQPANCACSLRGAQETGAASAAFSKQQAASENAWLWSEVPLNLTCCGVSPYMEQHDHLDLECAFAAACGRFCIGEIFFSALFRQVNMEEISLWKIIASCSDNIVSLWQM